MSLVFDDGLVFLSLLTNGQLGYALQVLKTNMKCINLFVPSAPFLYALKILHSLP